MRLHVHHIVPQEEGGSDEIENAAALCPNCHHDYGHDPSVGNALKDRRDAEWERTRRQEQHPDLAGLQAQLTEMAGKLDEVLERKEDLGAAKAIRRQMLELQEEKIEEAESWEAFEEVSSAST